ncbi:hypothetical protein RSAG8_12214, partial [Rhizoctonia solani AG-8 WAC10335]
MSKRRGRQPRKISTAPDAPRTYHVARMGARQEVRLLPHAPDEAAPSSTVHLAEHANPQLRDTLSQLVDSAESEFFAPSFEADFADPLVAEEEDAFRDELEAKLEDTAEAFARPKASGQGQNEMLQDWMNKYSNTFLRELYMEYGSPELAPCICVSPQGERFRCHDCITDHRFCLTCLQSTHQFLPHHRISKWDGDTWTRTSLAAQKTHLKLCNHPPPCLRTPPRSLLLGDINGFLEIDVTYCICPNAPEPYVQLLRSSIMPCSVDLPASGFTFRALRLYDLLSADAKLSCSRYHAVLQRQTNNIEPQDHPPRLRELLRVTRQWSYLQELKRTGQTSTLPKQLGALALRCPACPRLDINFIAADLSNDYRFLFSQLLSYDGSFQLVRKNKASDNFDICLTDGLMYWVDQVPYSEHLEANKETEYAQTTANHDTCNNHRAANDTWVRQSGVAETGVGAVTCARHTVFMPQGCVNYFKGERFAYTDYAMASVISMLQEEGADDFGVFYDIYCHWSKNFWSRTPRIQIPAVTLILKKIQEAIKMAEEQEEAWKVLHDGLEKELTDEWARMSTEPRRVKNKWTSVFLLDESTGLLILQPSELMNAYQELATSRIRTVIDLNNKESERLVDPGTTELGYTAPSWISDGIDIEKIQMKLRKDVASFGDKMTNRQTLEVYNRRVSLTSRIQSHRQSAAMFVDLKLHRVSALPSLAQETDGQPEEALLYLPSQMRNRLSITERSSRAIEFEQIKSQMLIGKGKNARGEVANARAQTMLNRLEQRIKNATVDYNTSFDALKKLGVTAEDLGPLKKINDEHFKGLMGPLHAARELEEGRRGLPWFWMVRELGKTGGIKEDEEELNEAIRVEWFRGRERFRRWKEEELWLRRELASTMFSFRHMKESWKDLSKSDYARINPGYRSYCIRQSDVYHGLLVGGLRRGASVLQERSDIKICACALQEFAPIVEMLSMP